MTWWSEWRAVYFELMTLATASPWEAPPGGRVYTDGDHTFYEDDIKGNFDEVEEQLWAFRNGLSDLWITITIKSRRNYKKRK